MVGYDSVLECVEAEIDLCEQMANTLVDERKALASLSYLDLNRCMHQRRLIEAEWKTVSRQRRALLTKLLPGRGALGELARLMPQGKRERLLSLCARLRALVVSVKREQRINLALVRSSLAMVAETLKLIRGEEEPLYDASAALIGVCGSASARWRA